MRDYSIEEAAKRIVDARTRSYFREVYSNYANGSYRSAVVMLWSVAVCDMLFKLEELQTTHADPTAEKILTDVEQAQAANPKSPAWEETLLELVAKRTFLLDVADVQNLEYLQQQRHLSAHPVLTGTRELHSPNKPQRCIAACPQRSSLIS